MTELFQLIGFGLVALLPLANPLTTMVLFLGLSQGMTPAQRKSQIRQTCIYVFVIMMVAFYGGQVVLHAFGISVSGLRIAGGLIVTLIGLKMLFSPEDSNSDTETMAKEEQIQDRGRGSPVNIAFVPLAMPSTAGPGTIAMLISVAAEAKSQNYVFSWLFFVVPPFVFLLTAALLWLSLRSSTAIMRYLGASGITAISRLMGFLLVCIGTQFVINGVLKVVDEMVMGG